MHSLKRTVLVTGASSGIGRATAKLLLQQGHVVIGTSRDCRQFKKQHPRFKPLEIDYHQLDSLTPILKQCLKQYPALNTVIFSAGYGQFGSLEQFSLAHIEDLMTVNFTAPVFITKVLLPHLKRQPYSNLIYIGSEAALKGSRKGTIYCASKFALRGFTQALRDECGTSSVRVSLINSGMVKTAFFEALNFKHGDGDTHVLIAEDIANTVDYILTSNPNSVIDEITLNPNNKVIQFKK